MSSVRDQITEILRDHLKDPQTQAEIKNQNNGHYFGLTCAQIKKKLAEAYAYEGDMSALSSVLHKMAKGGKLTRIEGVGPRGGYGYKLL